LDFEIKGIISEIIDMVFENQNMLETVNWILESDDSVRSKEDLALGYFIGSLMSSAVDVATDMKLNKINRQAYEKRLEQIHGKEEALKRLKEIDAKIEERRAKGGTPMTVELTEEETEEIKNMLIPVIARFREKLSKEEAFKKS
jgi:hypothetical protein